MNKIPTALPITALNSDPAGRYSAGLHHTPMTLVRLSHVRCIFLTYIYVRFAVLLGRAHSATGEHAVRT